MSTRPELQVNRSDSPLEQSLEHDNKLSQMSSVLPRSVAPYLLFPLQFLRLFRLHQR